MPSWYDKAKTDTLLGGKVATSDARLTDARTPLTHTHTASQVTDFDTAVGAKAEVATLNSVFGSKGGAPISPWLPPSKYGAELATVANLYNDGNFANLVTNAVALSVTAPTQTRRLIIKNPGAYYYRVSFDYDFTGFAAGGWWQATLAWKGSGDNVLGGNKQVWASQSMKNPLSGHFVVDIEAPAVGSPAGLEIYVSVSNNVTSGTATVSNISMKALAGPSRMSYFSGQNFGDGNAFIRNHYDVNERRWYVSAESFGQPTDPGGYAYGGIQAMPDRLPWQDKHVIVDPTFAQYYDGQLYSGMPGSSGLAAQYLYLTKTTMRSVNNDQIFIAQPLAGGAYEYQGNVHGGESLNGSIIAEVQADGTWSTVTSKINTECMIPAQRLRWTWPSKITLTGDAAAFVNVNHVFNAFPDGITRCDRTSTFTRATNISGVFEWMSSYDETLPRLGRMGRGADVTQSVDIFTHAAVPAAPTVTTATTGGTLPAATYSYRVSALTALGETLAGLAATVAATGSTSKTTIAWTAVTSATGYRVYGRTAGREALLATVGPGILIWDDTGAAGGTALPVAADTGRVPGSVAQVMPASDDSATWACWYDPISGWAHGNIYDREALLTRTASGVTSGAARLVSLPGIVKNYNDLLLSAETVTVPSGTAWAATHWSMIWRPEDPERFHHEIATRAASLSALKSIYPAT